MCMCVILYSILLTILCSVSILSILFELVLMSGFESFIGFYCRLSFSFVSLYP
jgi:hypothetical protein